MQETLVRVLAARDRIEPGMVEPYAIATVRNVDGHDVARAGPRAAQPAPRPRPQRAGAGVRGRGRRHRGAAPRSPRRSSGSTTGNGGSCSRTRSTGSRRAPSRRTSGSTAGAVAAQLKRTRARLRVEYLLALEKVEPPTERCRRGPARALERRPASAARGRRRPAPARVRPLLPAQRAAARTAGPVRDDEVRVHDQRRRGHRRRPAGRARAGGAGRVHRHRPHPARDGGLRGGPQHRALRGPRDRHRRAARGAPARHPRGRA